MQIAENDTKILLNLPYEDLKSACSINRYYNDLCSDIFWKEKIIYDFGETPISYIKGNYKDAYRNIHETKDLFYLTVDNFYINIVKQLGISSDEYIKEIPFDQLEYLFDDIDVNLINHVGNLSTLVKVYEKYGILPNTFLFIDDVFSIRWLKSVGVIATPDDADQAVEMENVEKLKALDITPRLIALEQAAILNSIPLLDWLVERGLPLDHSDIGYIAVEHHGVHAIPFIKRIHTYGIPYSDNTLTILYKDVILLYGDESYIALEQLEKEGFPLNGFSGHDNINTWKWLIKERGIYPDKELYHHAIEDDNIPLLDFLYSLGIDFDNREHIIERIGHKRGDKIFNWFEDRGLKFPDT